jgi:hypothetical protein
MADRGTDWLVRQLLDAVGPPGVVTTKKPRRRTRATGWASGRAACPSSCGPPHRADGRRGAHLPRGPHAHRHAGRQHRHERRRHARRQRRAGGRVHHAHEPRARGRPGQQHADGRSRRASWRTSRKPRARPAASFRSAWAPRAAAPSAATWPPTRAASPCCATATCATWCWAWKWCCPTAASGTACAAAQGQHRLRPARPVRRLGRHAGHHHRRRAQAVPAAGRARHRLGGPLRLDALVNPAATRAARCGERLVAFEMLSDAACSWCCGTWPTRARRWRASRSTR